MGTGDIHIRKKLHLDFFESFAFAGFAPAAGHIEGEISGGQFQLAGLRRSCQPFSHDIHDTGVGQRVGPRGAANGMLIHQYRFGNDFQPMDASVFTGPLRCQALDALNGPEQNIFRQGGFSRTGYAGDASHHPYRKCYIDVFQIVFRSPFDPNPEIFLTDVFGRRCGDSPLSGQIVRSDRSGNTGYRTVIHDAAAVLPGLGAHIDDPVGLPDDFRIMLHNNDGIGKIPKPLEDLDETAAIPRMQPDARLIQNIKRVDHRRSQTGCQGYPLDFAARKGAGLAVHRQISQAHILKKFQARQDFIVDHTAGIVRGVRVQVREKRYRRRNIQSINIRNRSAGQPVE